MSQTTTILDLLSLQTMPALVQRPAPAFKAAAVVDGLFQDISLSDYLGQWCVLIASLMGVEWLTIRF